MNLHTLFSFPLPPKPLSSRLLHLRDFSRISPTVLSNRSRPNPHTTTNRSSYSSSTSSARPSDHEIQTAREWLEKLHTNTIPKSVGSISFSRASGPGGQNVNKTESKATLKVPLEALLKHVPSALHSEIRSCRYYAKRTDALIFQADESRKLYDNLDSCYAKLHQVVLDAGKSVVPGETSAEQKKHVKSLQKADNERRLKGKKQHSSKKSSRRSRGDD